MKVAFICCTPYHIILSLHLAETKYYNFKKDIYICDHFVNANKIYNKLKDNPIFCNVFFIEDHSLNYDKSFLRYKKAYVMILRDYTYFIKDRIDLDYNELCVFTHNLFSKLFYAEILNRNENILVNLVEEGTSTYTSKYIEQNNFKARVLNVLSKLVNRKFFNNKDFDSLLLFKPELYSGNIKVKRSKISEIKKENTKVKDKLNSIFDYDYSSLPYEDYKFIFFDQTISKDGEIPVDEKKILFDMMEIINNDDIIVKLHPRDSKDKYKDVSFNIQSDGNLPWETIYLNLDLEDKVLITIRSSSVFTPKIVFNKENKIILLYKIAGIKDEEYEKFVGKFRKLYSRNTIYIPENWNEFREIIKII